MGFLIMVGAGAAALIAYAYAFESKRLTVKRSRFADREILTAKQIFDRYFADAGLDENRVIETWREVAAALHIDQGHLRPTDRFAFELAPVPGHLVEDELTDIEEMISRRVTSSFRAEPIADLGELVRALVLSAKN